jgi:hypothetical protein
MKSTHRIYRAKALDQNQDYIPANDLAWEKTDYVYKSYDEAYIAKISMQTATNDFYYKVVCE